VRRKLIWAIVGVLVLVVASPALAHVTVSPTESTADGFATLVFQVPHGCEGSPTTSLSIQIPPGVVSVKPQVKPGWDLSIEEGTLPEPVDYFGETLTEGVLSVTWSGGSLEDQFMDQFGMSVKLPPAAGETLYFPAVQTCSEGEHAWIQIPVQGQSAEELEEPAPAVLLSAGEETTDSTTTSTVSAEEDEPSSSSDSMAMVALVVGALGLITGGTALFRSRTRA
jgi:uncharacterized protein YcnI